MPTTASPTRAFDGVLLDWRGTLVVAPTSRWLATAALERLGRAADSGAIDWVLERLESADSTRVDSSQIDIDAEKHCAAYAEWFAAAGLDDELAAAMYACESDVGSNPFGCDVERLLHVLSDAGVRIGIISDIHVDPRPVFSQRRLPDGRTWAELMTAWVLSYEAGLAKPDPAVFTLALDRLGLPADRVLMVGDRGAWDGASAEVGITALIVPPLVSVEHARLDRVLDLVLPGHLPR